MTNCTRASERHDRRRNDHRRGHRNSFDRPRLSGGGPRGAYPRGPCVCYDRRNRDVESEAAWTSFEVWNDLFLVSAGALRVRDVPVAYALGRKLSLVHSRSDVVRLRLDRARSAQGPLAVLGQASYRGHGPVVHSDASCFLRRQWTAAAALEGPTSFHVLADTYSRRDTAHRSRASVAAVGASARRDFYLNLRRGYARVAAEQLRGRVLVARDASLHRRSTFVPTAGSCHDLHDRQHDGHLDQNTHHRRQRRARIEAEETDRSCHRKLEKIARTDQRGRPGNAMGFSRQAIQDVGQRRVEVHLDQDRHGKYGDNRWLCQNLLPLKAKQENQGRKQRDQGDRLHDRQEPSQGG